MTTEQDKTDPTPEQADPLASLHGMPAPGNPDMIWVREPRCEHIDYGALPRPRGPTYRLVPRAEYEAMMAALRAQEGQ